MQQQSNEIFESYENFVRGYAYAKLMSYVIEIPEEHQPLIDKWSEEHRDTFESDVKAMEEKLISEGIVPRYPNSSRGK